MTPTEILVRNLDCAFDRSSFHGTTLKGALRGLSVDAALERPAPDRKNIWEELLHCAYWKYIVRRHLSPDETPKFPRSPSNWPAPPKSPTKTQLRADIKLLTDEHAQLRAAVAAFDPARLEDRPTRGPAFIQLILGVAAHDLYHTGQIQLVKRLLA